MDTCHFCSLSKNIGLSHFSRFISISDHWFAIFDMSPINPGHSLIIARKHIKSIFEVTDTQWVELKTILNQTKQTIESIDLQDKYLSMLKQLEENISDKFIKATLNSKFLKSRPDAYNIGINDGKAAGQSINHLHVHLIPRFTGDVSDPTGGVRNVIPEKGNYRK